MPSKTYPVLAPVTCRSILIQQSRLLSFQLSANLLCASEREHMVGVLQLSPGTPAYQNQLHHERLAALSHAWAVRVADACHEILKTRCTCDISCIYKYKYGIYLVYT